MSAATESELKAFIENYAQKERMANTRKKQLLKMVLNPEAPTLDITACCGSSCQPCVKDLHKEELTLWHEARGLSVPNN